MDPENISEALELQFVFAKDAIIRKPGKKGKKDKKGKKSNDKKNDDKWILIV
jgi:hypothetical protein